MPATQLEKAHAFRALHESPGHFVIPNPWDGASARALASLGFKALATSSGACAAALGRRDGHVTRDEALAHAALIVRATDLPVSGDLEQGFGNDERTVAETIRLAVAAGLVGGSIEDSTGDPAKPIYEFGHAVARVAAAVEAARKLPYPFMLIGRAQNFVRGTPDLDDTIRRLKAFEAAGADVLMAPGLPDLDSVRAVCAATSKPFNFMEGIAGRSFPVSDLAAAGVKRISLATSLYRAAMTGFLAAAREVADHGTVGYIESSVDGRELNAFLES
jgi:2-methylisocitrate lyase-like PEP mutase family enzyme